MMVTIDRAGRVVIPKEVRDRLDLTAETELNIELAGDVIHVERPIRAARQLVWTEDGRPCFPAVDGHVLTDLDVQQIRDSDRR